MSLPSAAAWYARRGLHIFALATGAKVPHPYLSPRGYFDATPDATPWSIDATPNIGLSCIGSRIVVVDLDTHDAADELPGALPDTWTALTARGRHHLYRVADGLEPTWRGIPGAVDVKWRGYSILPPSIHPSGRRYEWEASGRPDEMPIADAPAWLVGHARERREYVSDGSAADSFLGACFAHLGMLGREIKPGVCAVRCPWEAEHTHRGGPSSTVIFAPSRGRLRMGRFDCRHSHCRERRADAVIAWMPKDALVAAALAGYRQELAMLGGRA